MWKRARTGKKAAVSAAHAAAEARDATHDGAVVGVRAITMELDEIIANSDLIQ